MGQPAVTKVGGAVVRSIVMSLSYMGAVAGISAVLWRVSPRLGSVILLGCSCLFMLKSYRREWRLGWVTCTLPLAAALGCYLIQAIALPTRPSPGFFGSAVLVGAAIGLLRGLGHRVSVRNGRVFAQRTLLYLLVWFGCIFATHGFAVFDLPRAANLGLIGGAFSTAAFVMVSLVLLFKYFRACRTHAKSDGAPAAGKVFALLAMAVFLTWPGRARANRMVDSFPLKYGSDIFSGSPFDRRLPTDDEIKEAVDSAMVLFRDEKFTATNLSAFEELHQERTVCEDAATRKFHKLNAVDHVKSSYLVVLFTQMEHVTRLVAAPPGFDGHQGYEDAKVVSYCCAWLKERNGHFEFNTSIVPHFPSRQARDEALNYWIKEHKLVIGFATEPSGADRAKPVALSELEKAALEAAVVAAALMLLASTGVGLASSVAQTVEDAVLMSTRMAASESAMQAAAAMKIPGLESQLYDEDGSPLECNQDGLYRWDVPGKESRWVTREEAEKLIGEEIAARNSREQRLKDFWDDTQRRSDEWLKEKAKLAEISNRRMEELRSREKMEEQARQDRQNRMLEKMRNILGEDAVDDKLQAGKFDDLEVLYRQKMLDQLKQGVTERADHEWWATAHGVGEKFAGYTVTASKTAMMAVGGPLGMAATGLGVGVISAAEEGAQSAARGESTGGIIAHSAVGFLSGAKDGAISVYTNLPGTGKVAKILVPSTCDVMETYVRTGDTRRALASGALSAASDIIGGRIDEIDSKAVRELSSAVLSSTSSGTATYLNGGSFADGFQAGFENHVAGRVGGFLGRKSARYADPEERVRAAIRDQKEDREREIPIHEQSEIVQKLKDTIYQENVVDEHGNILKNPDGSNVTKEYVDEFLAIKQLIDTKSSRTAKQAPKWLRDAIMNTRQDKLYAPADAETIRKTMPDIEAQKVLKPGDGVIMDKFSTPNEPDTLGADRDAREAIKRPSDSPKGYDIIELDRNIWEDNAYEDLYEHTTKIVERAGVEINEKNFPEFFERMKDLEYLKRPDTPEEIAALKARGFSDQQIEKFQMQGLTEEQIKHRAWGESLNQLFTDKNHVEASFDNADQSVRIIQEEAGIEVTAVQEQAAVTKAQQGKIPLSNPEGQSRLWEEKFRFYAKHNEPEAIAQCQKGIVQYMKLRKGYRAMNIEPPPINDSTSRAMEIISNAPVGVDATEAAMDNVKAQIRELGFKDIPDAAEKIRTQYELLKWSEEGQATVPVRDLKASDLWRVAKPKPDITLNGE